MLKTTLSYRDKSPNAKRTHAMSGSDVDEPLWGAKGKGGRGEKRKKQSTTEVASAIEQLVFVTAEENDVRTLRSYSQGVKHMKVAWADET